MKFHKFSWKWLSLPSTLYDPFRAPALNKWKKIVFTLYEWPIAEGWKKVWMKLRTDTKTFDRIIKRGLNEWPKYKLSKKVWPIKLRNFEWTTKEILIERPTTEEKCLHERSKEVWMNVRFIEGLNTARPKIVRMNEGP